METKYQYDFLVFIGRCQPYHLGHQEVIEKALELAKNVIVLIGSSNQPRTIKNPFTFKEREQMIMNSLGFNDFLHGDTRFQRVRCIPLRDQKYNDQAWAASVQRLVSDTIQQMAGWTDNEKRGGIIGHSKDESSYYLKMFPQWNLIDHSLNEIINATDIRRLYFESNLKYLQGVVPVSTYQFLDKFSKTEEYSLLVREQKFIDEYKKSWEAAPYAPTFLTCDSVVVQSGHVLLIQRKAAPGRGLWALPGGFVNQNERILDAAIRELREETRLKVPDPVLRGSIVNNAVFDHPDRSLRGRTITQAFHIELKAGPLPSVKGSDDAMAAKWVPISHIREEEMFEDHYSILQQFGVI